MAMDHEKRVTHDGAGQPAEPGSLAVMVDHLSRSWRFIFLWAFGSLVVSTIVAFLLPVQFKSTTSVFPAEEADLFSALDGVGSLAKSFAPRGLASLGRNTELDRYMAILKSGRVVGAVIDSFNLIKVYEVTSYPYEKASKILMQNTELKIEEEGQLTVTVYDEDPQRAADMANFFVWQLNKTNAELKVQNAKGNRGFIQERYEKNLRDLAAAEDSMKAFQKRYGVIAMPEQTVEAIKAGAELAAQLAMKEVTLGVLSRTQSAESPLVANTRIEVEEMRRKMGQMTSGQGGKPSDMKLLVPFNEIPDLGSEYLRRYRDVEIQYKILQFLTPLYEQAKVEEKKNTPSVIILDRAAPAERKARPKRLLVMLGGLFIGLVVSVGYVALREKWSSERSRGTPVYHAVTRLVETIREDTRRWFSRSGRSRG
jgi:uncharacterized protein involved in exopolysaccharide biosynthesis